MMTKTLSALFLTAAISLTGFRYATNYTQDISGKWQLESYEQKHVSNQGDEAVVAIDATGGQGKYVLEFRNNKLTVFKNDIVSHEGSYSLSGKQLTITTKTLDNINFSGNYTIQKMDEKDLLFKEVTENDKGKKERSFHLIR